MDSFQEEVAPAARPADKERPRSIRHSLAAMSHWAQVDPDERVRLMTEMSRKAAAKRAAERAAREAAGEMVKPPKRRTRSTEALPPISDLLPLMESIQVERKAAGLPDLAVDPLMREAALRIRRSIAQATYEVLKADEQ